MKNWLHIVLLGGLVLTGAGLLSSCNQEGNKEEIALVDSLQTEIENSEKLLKGIPADKFEQCLTTADENMDVVDNNKKDTLDVTTAVFIADYSNIRKTLSKFPSRKNTLLREIEYSKNQLKELKHDLQQNLLRSDSARVYVEIEKKANLELINQAKALTENVKQQMNRFDSLNPKMINIVEQLQSAGSKKI